MLNATRCRCTLQSRLIAGATVSLKGRTRTSTSRLSIQSRQLSCAPTAERHATSPPPSLLSSSDSKPLICLGIETSCDDTCAAIVTSDRVILSEVLRTQHHLHEPMGGIVPVLAHHAHMQQLPGVVKEAIEKANLSIQDVDLVAVTRGPGLAHSLGVGLNAAKTLAAAMGKPLIGVHHMEAHALTARLTTPNPVKNQDAETTTTTATTTPLVPVNDSHPYPPFPFLTLLVSGGHTLLLIAHKVDHYTTLATTVDDSIGDAFDKTARELEIPWLPGRAGGPGASLEAFAKKSSDPRRFVSQLPVPMSLRHTKREMKFSFAGVKSTITRVVQREKELDPENTTGWKQDLAAGFQHAVITHLANKLEQGFEYCQGQGIAVSSLVISGGVGRNETLRQRLKEICDRYEYQPPSSASPPPTLPPLSPAITNDVTEVPKKKKKKGTFAPVMATNPIQLICPPPKLCTDNAVMIAWTGIERYRLGLVDPYEIDIIPKWPLDMLGTGKIPE